MAKLVLVTKLNVLRLGDRRSVVVWNVFFAFSATVVNGGWLRSTDPRGVGSIPAAVVACSMEAKMLQARSKFQSPVPHNRVVFDTYDTRAIVFVFLASIVVDDAGVVDKVRCSNEESFVAPPCVTVGELLCCCPSLLAHLCPVPPFSLTMWQLCRVTTLAARLS